MLVHEGADREFVEHYFDSPAPRRIRLRLVRDDVFGLP
jgi:hypothetical protein